MKKRFKSIVTSLCSVSFKEIKKIWIYDFKQTEVNSDFEVLKGSAKIYSTYLFP